MKNVEKIDKHLFNSKLIDIVLKIVIEIVKCKNNKEKIYIYTELFYYQWNKLIK